MDVLTKKQRSYCMSQIKGRNSNTEVVFRKMLWAAGIRGYRLHAKLPGRPDIFFPKRKIAIFVDGCFWHKCPKCYVRPKTNKKFWDTKIAENRKRDRRIRKSLSSAGIVVVRFWQHEILSEPESCRRKILDLLNI